MWMDPERELYVILLTNRVHPTRENNTIRDTRAQVADAVVRALDRREAPGLPGRDRPAARGPARARGLRRGRRGARAGRGRPGRAPAGPARRPAGPRGVGRRRRPPRVDVLRGAGVDVVRLFGPEHGLRGPRAAGEEVAGGVDAASGLPVVSLYGARTKPAAEDLRGLDALVVDLQDAGVRFYTYASTMLLCLEAAAEAGLEVVVLDRPNPLGGERVEGPERDPAMPFSLVSAGAGSARPRPDARRDGAVVANARRETSQAA